MLATLDKFGRVLIPKKLRKHLGLAPESSINIIEDGARIIIEPVTEQEPLKEKNGLLIFTGKIQDNLNSALDRNRFNAGDKHRRAPVILFPGHVN